MIMRSMSTLLMNVDTRKMQGKSDKEACITHDDDYDW